MAKSPELFTIFYCWQNDTPRNHARHLIRKALDQVADLLNADATVPFHVAVDQDTHGLTGLCDIPAAILAKIETAGAVVCDLTYVAKVRRPSETPKYCSNPNVLFELGYAFRAIGPERIVCVMNESCGPLTGQIFDLHHRRFPVAYASPAEGVTRRQAIANLTDSLAAAIRPIVMQGPRTLTSDDGVRHESDRSQIAAFDEAKRSGRDGAAITFALNPAWYHERRWPDAQALERLMWDRATYSGRHEFPPQQRGTAAMPWGIFNGTYGDNWALTYSGQFWMRHFVQADYESPRITGRMPGYSYSEPVNESLQSGTWLDYAITLRKLFDCFKFSARLSEAYGDAESLSITAMGSGFTSKWMMFTSHLADNDPMGPCESPGFTRRWETAASDFRENWRDVCVDWMKEICDLFSRDGRYVDRSTLLKRLEHYDLNRE